MEKPTRTSYTSKCGHARFTPLTPAVMRLEWSLSGTFEDRPSINFIQRNNGDPGVVDVSRPDDDCMRIETSDLVLSFQDGPDAAASTSWEDRLTITVKAVGTSGPAIWMPNLHDSGNLQGTCRTLDGVSGATLLQPGLVSRDGWTVQDDSKAPLLEGTHPSLRGSASGGAGGLAAHSASPAESNFWADRHWPVGRPDSTNNKDLYFFGHGHKYKQALKDFTLLAGRIPLPPRWSFGLWWSRYWPYTEEEFKGLIGEFREHDVPVDVLVMDMDWHLDGWTGYSWNPKYFKDPAKFMSWCHEQGLSVTLNLHPADGVAPHETSYKAVADQMGVASGTVPFDITSKEYMDAYFRHLHHPREDEGVDFWWIDWQQQQHSAVPGLDPLFWLNHLHWVDMQYGNNPSRRGRRPLLLSRWGGLGNHRYQIGFSGDTYSNWESLTFQVKFTATAGNVCYPFFSHDIGGHFPGPVEDELFVRWIQWAAFNPFLRTHSTRSELGERRMWKLPLHFFRVARAAVHLRYSLLPYIYLSAHQAHADAIPLNRPLYYEWPEHDEAYTFEGTYMFGDQLLCSPITSAVNETNGMAATNVWFPPGVWYSWFTGQRVEGPTTKRISASIHDIPVFVKAGGIIPTDPKKSNTRERTTAPMALHVFPGASGSVSLYEDDGDTLAYTNDGPEPSASRTTLVTMAHGLDDTVEVSVEPASGTYAGAPEVRNVEIRFRETWPASSLQVDSVTVPIEMCVPDGVPDATCAWYDSSCSTTVVFVREVHCTTGVKIAAKFDLATSQDLLHGGLTGRLASVHRVLREFPDYAPPELEEFVDHIQATYLSMAGMPGPALPAAIQSVFSERWCTLVAAVMMASRGAVPMPGRSHAGFQMLACMDLDASTSVVARHDTESCRCKDPETHAFVPVAPHARYWAKWVKASGGHLKPTPSEVLAVRWTEYSDAGDHFAEFTELSREGNCPKCMTVTVFDESRSMYVKATPSEFAWSSDNVQWNIISSGKWVTLNP